MMVDTLTIARELKAAELPDGQAEAIAAAIGRCVAEGAATKGDLETLRVAQKSDLEAAKHELRTDLERIRGQLLVWFIGTQVAVGGLIVALIKL